MSRCWIYSDPHFYHHGIVKFLRHDGTKLRPWDDANLMSEEMIEWYNEVVHPEDRVYILGDLAMTRAALDKSLPRLMGRKILVKGNHDTDKLSYYTRFFDDIRAYVPKKGFVLSHIPIHPGSLSRWSLNIHGHLHAGKVPLNEGKFEGPDDRRYYCACVEHTNYRPILLDQILDERGLKETKS